MTFKRFLDTFKSGTKLVYVAKEYVPGYVPHGKTRTQVPSSAAVRGLSRVVQGIGRFEMKQLENFKHAEGGNWSW